MEKTRINIDIVLPQIAQENDSFVKGMVEELGSKRGIDRVHILPAKGNAKAQFCFHYDPSLISIHKIEQLAKKAGAGLTEQYGHLLIEVSGIRHPTHAGIIESKIKKWKGILSASVSGNGFIQLEYKKDITTEATIIQQLKKRGLGIRQVENFQPSVNGNGRYAEKHDHDHDHEHHKHGLFGERTEFVFAAACGFFLLAGFVLSFFQQLPSWLPIVFYSVAYFFGGFYTTKEAIAGLSKGKFDIDFLMLVAAIGAAVLGEWVEGALLLFLFSLGHSLEHYAMEKARKSIAALAELAPKTALLKKDNQLTEVKIEMLKPGDIIFIKPNSTIAADGFVIMGSSSVNQAPITGESIPVDKMPVDDSNLDLSKADKLDARHRVFAGSINGGEAMEVKVTRIAADSTIARLVKMVHEAQTQKSATQNFTDKLTRYYVPSILILVVLLLFAFLVIDETFSQSFYRAMAVLVAASPCALAISTPSAVLSGVARAARGGVLVKGGKPLEALGALNAIAFDKTGTITEGKPKLTGVYPLNGTGEEQLLEIVIAVEQLSDHPLAAAIIKGGLEKLKREVKPAGGIQSITGRGVKASHFESTVLIGNKELFLENENLIPGDIQTEAEELERNGNTTMLVQKDGVFIGMITLMDVARADAKDTLARLKTMGIRKMVMLTGDNQRVAEAVAKEVGLTEAWGNLLPEQKVAAIEKLRDSEKMVAMVGDGVNDAPAMAKSTVGIAMGAAGSDVALETADIALMADQLSNLPFAIGLSKKAHTIIRQNIIISLGMVALLIPLTITGLASMGPAVIGHEGSTVLVVFNALRLLAFRKESS